MVMTFIIFWDGIGVCHFPAALSCQAVLSMDGGGKLIVYMEEGLTVEVSSRWGEAWLKYAKGGYLLLVRDNN